MTGENPKIVSIANKIVDSVKKELQEAAADKSSLMKRATAEARGSL